MFILAVGMLARAAVGPAERLLNMLGERKQCATVYAIAFAINLVLCVLLIPRIGIEGAAVATSTALVMESIMLYLVAKRRLGFHVFIMGGGQSEQHSRLLAQQPPDHLAGRGHRHRSMKATSRGYSCAESRVLTKPWISAASASDGRVAGLQHDEGLDDLGAHRIGLADHGGERHRRMPDQAILDLARADAEAGRGDDVVVAADES